MGHIFFNSQGMKFLDQYCMLEIHAINDSVGVTLLTMPHVTQLLIATIDSLMDKSFSCWNSYTLPEQLNIAILLFWDYNWPWLSFVDNPLMSQVDVGDSRNKASCTGGMLELPHIYCSQVIMDFRSMFSLLDRACHVAHSHSSTTGGSWHPLNELGVNFGMEGGG